MPLRDPLLAEFDQEMQGTRKVLERVPEDRLDWKPNEKSGSLGWLASHVAQLPQWLTMTLTTEELDIDPPGGATPRPPVAQSRQELLDRFDQHSAAARKLLSDATDEQLMGSWTLLIAGKRILTLPRVGVVRSFVLSHIIHHRGQLTIYLRMNNVAPPGLYGPTAEEAGW